MKINKKNQDRIQKKEKNVILECQKKSISQSIKILILINVRCSGYSSLLSATSTLYSCSTHRFSSTLLCYTLPSTSLLCILYSSLPLPCLYSTLPRLYFTQEPTGHNDLWASENVTSRSLNAGANWTQ